MKVIILEIMILVLVVAFVTYLAFDDRKNRRLREEEDRQKALQQPQAEVESKQD